MENVGLILPRSLCLFSTLLPNLPYIQVRVRSCTLPYRSEEEEETKNDLISFEIKLLKLKKDFYSTRIMAYSCLEIKAQ